MKESIHWFGFAPSIDTNCTTLILGSMPSAASLAAGQYYAHPQNRFWPLMAQLLEDRGGAPEGYADRLRMLLRHHVALWDSINTCDREGSLDSAIKNETANNFSVFLEKWPALHTIGLNGGKAYTSFARANRPLLTHPGLRVVKLPSTSPANASWRMADLIMAWSQLFDSFS